MINSLAINSPYIALDKNQYIAVKIVDDSGVEGLRVIGVEQ